MAGALTPVAGLPLVVWLALAAGVLRYVGAVWDVSWHRTIGRDTFWAPPHMALYAGVAVAVVTALWALEASRRRPLPGARVRLGRREWPLSLLLAALGPQITALSAPFDDLWHALYGRDVDIWSPPHLVAIAGSGIGTLGWTMAVIDWRRARTPGYHPRLLEAVAVLLLAFLLYTGWFALNWYHMASATRDTLLYPSLVAVLLLPVLVAARQVRVSGDWTATAAAGTFMLLAAVPMPLLEGLGWRAPAFPPLLVVPALATDLLLGDRRASVARLALLGGVFAALFLAVEMARLALVPPPDVVGFERAIAAPHLAAAAARPWSPSAVLLALPLVAVVSVGGALLGAWLARLLGRADAGLSGSPSRTMEPSLRHSGDPLARAIDAT